MNAIAESRLRQHSLPHVEGFLLSLSALLVLLILSLPFSVPLQIPCFLPRRFFVWDPSPSRPLSPHPRISGGNKLKLEKATHTWSRGTLRLVEVNDFDLSVQRSLSLEHPQGWTSMGLPFPDLREFNVLGKKFRT